MELKFLLFTFVVLFAVFGSIETKYRSSSRGSSSRGSSSRGSSSRGSSSSSSSSRGSSSSNYGSSSNRGSTSHGSSPSWTSTNRGSTSHGTNTHRSPSSNTGSFLNSERTHVSNTGNRPSTSNSNNRNNGNNNSQYRPFSTVPTPTRPNGNHNKNPHASFPTVPTRHVTNGANKPTPPPAGFVIPGGHGSQAKPTVNPIHPVTRSPLVTSPKHNYGRNNGSASFLPPSRGFNSSSFNPSAPLIPGTYHPTHTTNLGGSPTNYPRQPPYNPSIGQPSSTGGATNYPRQPPYNPSIGQPSSTGGATNYPRQPAYNPSISQPSQPVYSPYPGHHPPSQPSYSPYPGHHSPSQPSYSPYPGHHSPSQPSYSPYPGHHSPSQPSYSPYPGHQSTPNVGQPHQTNIYHNYAPVAPPHSAQTVVVVPGANGYSRTTGDIFKEAIIHAGVNAAVNRLTSPSHYYDNHHYSSWNSYAPPSSGQSTVTHTQITNNNYYDQNPGGASGNGGGGTNFSPSGNNNPQLYPNGVQGGSSNGFNTQGNYGNNGNQGNPVVPITPGSPGVVNSPTLSNGQSSPSQNNNGNGQANSGNNLQNGPISDQDIFNITEKLFSLDENNATKYISLNLQKQVDKNNTNVTDLSPQPLFNVDQEAYKIPTIKAIRALYQSSLEMENKTRTNSRKEEALFVDLILNTNVMTAAMNFLVQKNLISNDYYTHKDMLKHIWFTPYDDSSSGFKRVFQGKIWEGILLGIQDWIAFDFQEKAGRANYFSYSEKLDFGKTSASLLKVNFEMAGNVRTGTQLFVGTSPELQMALYTICAYTRPFYSYPYCNVTLGGTKLTIYTHTDRYFGKDLINAAFPLIL